MLIVNNQNNNMNKAEFIAEVLAEPIVESIVDGSEIIVETQGDYQKGHFTTIIMEPQGGRNFRPIWFIRNTVTDETGYQTANTLDPTKNLTKIKQAVLTNYLETNFEAYFIERLDFVNNWAEATVYEVATNDLSMSKVLVYKKGTNPVTHKKIV